MRISVERYANRDSADSLPIYIRMIVLFRPSWPDSVARNHAYLMYGRDLGIVGGIMFKRVLRLIVVFVVSSPFQGVMILNN